jgi:uncharacterized protein YcbK (DUF882 family)
VPNGTARASSYRFLAKRAGYSCGVSLLIVLFCCRGLQNAVADGDTRTITMHHVHTNEDITITYKRNGRYDDAALEKLNWFLRDWRKAKETRMDPQLIDLLWEVQRETGSKAPIEVVCGYRSPDTNAMLRRRSSGVARFSQHMLGHAVDFYIPGVPLDEIRVIGLRMQRGGVGFYPTSGSPFVHMDTGGVRMWPRMTRNELMRVFPDGRTVYLPTDGHPLPGYALALADLRSRGQNPTETWIEEAHEQGLDQNIVLASEQHRAGTAFGAQYAMSQADREEDDTEAAESTPPTSAAAVAPATAAAATTPANALLAALEREAAHRRGSAESTAQAAVGNGGAVYQVASYTPPMPPPSQSPQPMVQSTPSQVISTRGYWPTSASEEIKAEAAELRRAAARRALAASVADSSGIITPGALEDRVSPEVALAYIRQSDREASDASPPALTTGTVVAQAQPPQLPAETTIAIKRAADQVASTVVTARPRDASPPRQGAQYDDPWLDAIMVSPSVRRYLTVLLLGAQDYRSLAALVEKPTRLVPMTFGSDPNPGLTPDHFTGSAVVFITTASLQ